MSGQVYFLSKEEAEEVLKRRVADVAEDMALVESITQTQDIFNALKTIETKFFASIVLANDIMRQNRGEE